MIIINLFKKIKEGPGSGGFTLVELLIVIGLLGAIALIVIAAINPIEQANRARDTKYKSDAGQLVSAIDRYFASRNEFPWMVAAGDSAQDALPFITVSDPSIGLCGTTCTGSEDTSYGVLITNDELKPEFRNRDFVSTIVPTDQIVIGKEGYASASIYACFTPRSKSFRQTACDGGNVYTMSGEGTRSEPIALELCSDMEADGWDEAEGKLYRVCVPE